MPPSFSSLFHALYAFCDPAQLNDHLPSVRRCFFSSALCFFFALSLSLYVKSYLENCSLFLLLLDLEKDPKIYIFENNVMLTRRNSFIWVGKTGVYMQQIYSINLQLKLTFAQTKIFTNQNHYALRIRNRNPSPSQQDLTRDPTHSRLDRWSLFEFLVDLAGSAEVHSGLGRELVGSHLESDHVFACIHLVLWPFALATLWVLGSEDWAVIAGFWLDLHGGEKIILITLVRRNIIVSVLEIRWLCVITVVPDDTQLPKGTNFCYKLAFKLVPSYFEERLWLSG